MFWLVEEGSDKKLVLLLLLDFLGVARHGPGEGPAGVGGFCSSLPALGSLAAPAEPLFPPAHPAPDVPVLVAVVCVPSAAGSVMFSANSSSSISRASSLCGTLTALALLYSFNRSMLTTRVPLFSSCLP